MKRQQNITRFLKLTNSRSVVPSEKPSTSAEDVVEPSVLNSSRKSAEPIEISCQPDKSYPFPKRDFGKRKRLCQPDWFRTYNWLHYRPDDDSVICYICANQELKGNLISASNKDYAFISTGFCNWKKATMQFDSHMCSSCHKTALTFHVTVPACKEIEAILSSEVEKARKSERNYFRKVMEAVQELARQGIPFQSSEDKNDNFCRMLLLRGKDDPEVAKRVLDSSKSKMNKYTHDQYQNELIDIMAHHVLRAKVSIIIDSPFYGIMADEYTDVSNKEQLSFSLRWVDRLKLNIHEDFLGFYEVANTKSETIVQALKDILTRFNLHISKCRGQTYDGASEI